MHSLTRGLGWAPSSTETNECLGLTDTHSSVANHWRNERNESSHGLMSEFIQNGSVIIWVFSHWIVYFHYVTAPSMQLLAINYNPHESFSFIWGPVLFFPRPLRTCSVQRSTNETILMLAGLSPSDYASLIIERFIVVFECQPAARWRGKEPGC